VLSLGLGAAPAFGGAGADKITLHIRSPPSTASIKRRVLVPVSAHGSAGPRLLKAPQNPIFLLERREQSGATLLCLIGELRNSLIARDHDPRWLLSSIRFRASTTRYPTR
jgi:hypothetical protein